MTTVEISTDADDVLNQISIDYIVEFYGAVDLLQEIGSEEAKDYFDLTEKV